eukprot:6470730-Amphidinium_carterae.4
MPRMGVQPNEVGILKVACGKGFGSFVTFSLTLIDAGVHELAYGACCSMPPKAGALRTLGCMECM